MRVLTSRRRIHISLLEFLFPPRCSICNVILSPGSPICLCRQCAAEMDYFNNNINHLYLPDDYKIYCDGIICVGRYCSSLKKSIKKFKFSNRPSYYRTFGKLLALKVQNTPQLGEIDIIIPVPMHKNRQRQRGYNQAELIAGFTAGQLGIKSENHVLIKTVETKTQSLLSKSQRLSNLEGSFKVNLQKRIEGRSILLVDDIVTTGSTINQCCKALKLAGAERVIAGVIATTRVDS